MDSMRSTSSSIKFTVYLGEEHLQLTATSERTSGGMCENLRGARVLCVPPDPRTPRTLRRVTAPPPSRRCELRQTLVSLVTRNENVSVDLDALHFCFF